MKKLTILLALILAVLVTPVTVAAQTSINVPTLSNAITTLATRQDIVVSSATGIAVNSTFLWIDGSVYQVNAISGTTITVTNTFRPATHNASVNVYVVPVGAQLGLDPVGSCIRGTGGRPPQYSPYTLMFNFTTGRIAACRIHVLDAGKFNWRLTSPYDAGTPSDDPPQTQ